METLIQFLLILFVIMLSIVFLLYADLYDSNIKIYISLIIMMFSMIPFTIFTYKIIKYIALNE